MICLKYKAFNDYYFCPNCYREFKGEILANAPWVVEIKRIFWREQKQARKVNQNEIFLDDLNLAVGTDGEIYYNGETI